ncbi:MAG: hypothetical protein QG618_1499 [Thermodesulfobacteriota bacterium]|jgi:predicted RNase H-like HicB family nuclease|uniref:DUF1902 domain-containing protein n=1 Tax=Desulfobacter sp. TaxID=2294 RepID=UPI00257D5FE7|nr:DUF1902 domain-containing protein [Desulfobacter sp.]MDQ1270189.1 hypothetical protein [Thermodesulfobacteriota bacterium]
MNKKPYFIRAEWDDEADVWVASSEDVLGLATESATLEGLIEKLKVMIPELLEANGEDVEQETPFVVDNAIKSRHTANAVLKQAGLPKQF